MKHIYLTLILLLTGGWLHAQVTPQIMRQGGTGGNSIPLGNGFGNWRGAYLYAPADLVANPGFSKIPGVITKIYFRPTSTGTGNWSNLTVSFTQTTATSFPAGNTPFDAVTVALPATNLSGVSYTNGQWFAINLATPFFYDPTKTLIVDVSQSAVNNGPALFSGNSTGNKRRQASPATSTSGNTDTSWPDFGFDLAPAGNPSVIANFTVPATGCKNSPVSFVNNTIISPSFYANAARYKWRVTPPGGATFTFDPHDSSRHVKISFQDTGVYTIKLVSRLNNNPAADSITKTIRINLPSSAPVANFFSPRLVTPEASELVPFFDLSTDCPQSWEWSSPDYELATGLNPFINPNLQNPTAFFVKSGTWQICLKVTNAVGTHTTCKTAYIKVVAAKSFCVDTISVDKEGFIFDEGGINNNYFANRNSATQNCKGFTINPCAASITLTFEKWKFAANDSLIIHNGPNRSAPVIFRGGSNLNGTLPVVIANSGKMHLHFISDNAATVDSGFVARWISTQATYPKPVAGFTTSKQNGMGTDTFSSGYRFQLNNTTAGIDPTFSWDVNADGGDDSTMVSPTGIFFNFTSSPAQYTIRLIARNCIGNDTTYRTVTILPVNSKPSPIDFVADIRVVTSTDTVSFTDLSVGATAWEWSFTPSNVTYVQGFSRFSQNPKVLFAGAGCVKAQLKVSNSSGSDSVAKTAYICLKTYCPPGSATTPSSDIGFSQVSIGAINNVTAIGVSEYTDYADSSFGNATLYRGTTYTINVKRNTNSSNISWKGWIDWNQDGDFYDNGEEIFSQFNSSTVNSSFQVTVPTNARLSRTRLRVGATAGTNFLDPCASYLGEFEDYRITIGSDNIAPVITLNGADTVYIEVGSSYADLGATAVDNLEGNITPKVVSSSTVDTSIVGVFKVCYDVEDLYGNKAATKCRVVIVKVDLTAPVITLKGPSPQTIQVNSVFVDSGATAFDNYSGDITAAINVSGTVNPDSVGSYTLTYTVADFFGFTATKNRIVNVVDTVKPVLSRVTSTANHIHLVGMPLVNANVVSSADNYYKNLVPVRTGIVDVNALGVYPVVYNLTDGSGNIALSLAVNIEVKDTLAPVINTGTTDTVTIEVFSPYTVPSGTVTDNFYTLANITYNVNTGGFDHKKVGTFTVTYTATDGSNNQAVKTLVIKVVDTKKPVITPKAGNGKFLAWSLGKPWVDPGVQIKDNYYDETVLLPLLQTNLGGLDVNKAGVYTVTYQVTDPSGNKSDISERVVLVGLTSARNLNFAGEVKVYPNPSAGIFKLDVQMQNTEDVQVVVMDMMGHELLTLKQDAVSQHSFDIDLGNRAAGVYLLRVMAGAETAVIKVNLVH